jgi:8-oxo-dGTP pyrophosphatase MutT (NUDIX family)
MSVIDLLKKVVEAIAVDEASVWGETRHASVGILIAGENQSPSICFIRRAKWERDPWSEHIAFPGGSRAADEDALQTLRRELEEEIGWIIDDCQPPVRLPQLCIRLAGRERLLLLDAFIYRVEGEPPALRCSETLVYPAIRTSQGIIFGITLRVLTLLSDQFGIPLRYLEEIPMLRRTPTR